MKTICFGYKDVLNLRRKLSNRMIALNMQQRSFVIGFFLMKFTEDFLSKISNSSIQEKPIIFGDNKLYFSGYTQYNGGGRNFNGKTEQIFNYRFYMKNKKDAEQEVGLKLIYKKLYDIWHLKEIQIIAEEKQANMLSSFLKDEFKKYPNSKVTRHANDMFEKTSKKTPKNIRGYFSR